MLVGLYSIWQPSAGPTPAATISGTPRKRPKARHRYQLPPYAEPGMFVSPYWIEQGKEELLTEEEIVVLAAMEID